MFGADLVAKWWCNDRRRAFKADETGKRNGAMSKHATALHWGLGHASAEICKGVPQDHSCFACVT
jgi:hypothetical protein